MSRTIFPVLAAMLAYGLMGGLVAASAAAAETAAEAPAAPPAEPASASAAAAEPAAETPAAEKIPATVKEVEGTVETRAAVGEPWTPVEAGQTLAEGADLRTGFRARCILDMTDSLVQVEALSVVRIGRLEQEGETVHTRLFLKQGNTQSIIEKGRLESDFEIVTPSTTLSVRGTWNVLCGHFSDVGSQFGLTGAGLLGVTNTLGQTSLLGPGQQANSQFFNPIFFQAAGHLPNVADQFGFELSELFAAFRGGAGFPIPPGLTGPAGLLGLNPQQGGQQFGGHVSGGVSGPSPTPTGQVGGDGDGTGGEDGDWRPIGYGAR